MPPLPETIFGVGVAASSLVLCSSAVVALCIVCGWVDIQWRKTIGFVLGGLFVSAVLRLVWWCLLFLSISFTGQYVLNRLVWLFVSLTYLLLLFGFMETIHARIPPPSNGFLPAVKVAFIITASVITLFVVIVIILAYTLYATIPSEGNALYDANILFIAALQVLLSILFLLYGSMLMYRISHNTSQHNVEKARRSLIRVLIVSVVYFLSFAGRAVALLYRPITNSFFAVGAFYAFAYIVPETFPAFAQIFVILHTGLSHRSVDASIVIDEVPSTGKSEYEMRLLAHSQSDSGGTNSDDFGLRHDPINPIATENVSASGYVDMDTMEQPLSTHHAYDTLMGSEHVL